MTEMTHERMRDLMSTIDSDNDGTVSYKEFSKIMQMPEAIELLDQVDVSPLGIVDFAEMFFFEDGKPIELSFENFMEMVLDLRESNIATVKDVHNFWMKIKTSCNRQVVEMRRELLCYNKNFDAKADRIESQNERTEAHLASVMSEVRRITSHVSIGSDEGGPERTIMHASSGSDEAGPEKITMHASSGSDEGGPENHIPVSSAASSDVPP